MANTDGPVAELVYAEVLKTSEKKSHMGSNPIGATNPWNGYRVMGPYYHGFGQVSPGRAYMENVGYETISPLERLAIEQAAAGLISGNLDEWSVLRSALRKLHLPSNLLMPATHAKNLCKLIIGDPTWKS